MQEQQPQTRRRKKLNIPVIKGVIMMGLGTFFGFLSAMTGISPQIAAVPMIVFLLGFIPARAQGTALAYALCTAIGGIAGATAGGLRPDYVVGFLIALSATVGAVLAGRAAAGPRAKTLTRVGQSVAILISLFVIMEALRHRIGGPRAFGLDFLIDNRLAGAAVIGLVVGSVAQLLHVTAGVLFVPALVYFAALRVSDSITTSLVVIAFASLLPTLSYATKQAIDKGPGYWMCIGGTLGGLAGGLLLGRIGLEGQLSLVLFGLAAMILSGWTLSRIS